MATTGTSPPAGVTVLFTQDALDADNYPALVGALRVRPIIDVSTAFHDLRLPRFRGPMIEAAMLSTAGFSAMPLEHQLQLDDSGVPLDPEIITDAKKIQHLSMLVFNEVLMQNKALLTLVKEERVQLCFVRGNLTMQGLWTPIVPNTFLFYSAKEDRMRTADEVNKITKDKESNAWTGSGTAASSETGSPSEWNGYFPAREEGDTGKCSQHRLDPVSASKLPGVGKAFDELRKSFREFIDEEIKVMTERNEKSDKHNAVFAERETVLSQLRSGNTAVYIILCAPAGFTWEAYKAIRDSSGGIRRIRAVTGDVLTIDPADNLVGRPWNEWLDVKAMSALLLELQKDSVPSIFTPTQLFKGKHSSHLSTAEHVSKEMGEKAEHAKKADDNSGFSCIRYQGLWNSFKHGYQPIFDPLAVFLMMHQLQVAHDGSKESTVSTYKGRIKLLPIKLDETLQVHAAGSDPSTMYIPDTFSEVVPSGCLLKMVQAGHVLTSPFENDSEREKFKNTLYKWYGMEA
eukprot:CAMPEP_0181299178 /NCGR_PEP_ID=MMETSP1101-20121128/6197_1 /TAXON_ID=46948 /ORGANISM="Rhodomonas abbreviata, Strain Caron Lab Isolate" /LENGTH=514 /DNA_ID=CAMNT_0023404289 /DNA_START=6 /DNA_END=1549 /DNA_ORIENTATION=-